MNIFRLCGDMLHLFSFAILGRRLYATKSAAGISLKSQQLFLVVWCTRYLDLFTHFFSVYNTTMKILYIALSSAIVYTIEKVEPFKSTNDRSLDTFLHWKFAVAPCAVLALVTTPRGLRFALYDITWVFSIWLEALAIVPQLVVLQRVGEGENLARHFVLCVGAYRACYMLNWLYRYMNEPYYTDWTRWIAGSVQLAFHLAFMVGGPGMNIFRLCGDMLHLFSFVVLGLRLYATKSAAGISLKSQQLFLVVWCTRYLDLFTHFYSVYNTTMKILYIALSSAIVYTIEKVEPFKSTNDRSLDTFLHWKFAVAPCAVVALVVNHGFSVSEIMWSFSIWLEALAIVPQLIILQRFGEVENLTGHYVFCMGAYRACYMLNWVYRYMYEPHYSNWISWIAGSLQTALYLDFMYYYLRSKYAGLATTTLPK